MKRLLLPCLLVSLFSNVTAKEVAGINLVETMQRAEDGVTLELNGAGVREKFFFDIYVAALYLQQKSNQASVILNSEAAARVEMRMLYSEVKQEKFVQGWNDGFSANLGEAQFKQLVERLNQFNGWFETLTEGEMIELDYFPGKGTRVKIKGVEKGVIPGGDFFQALLSVWLGEKPVTKSLKEDLLGL
ncbi:MAG: chalcone isomerase family protein [Candidatus Thiodiazotropha endolucinida]|nr:chalcone isomerase family protein [Candidatus Thiodiazotropha taylori]MCW4316100.1 chalcone isomerase family protein [Candidatus Thiodiazotropha taylori]